MRIQNITPLIYAAATYSTYLLYKLSSRLILSAEQSYTNVCIITDMYIYVQVLYEHSYLLHKCTVASVTKST